MAITDTVIVEDIFIVIFQGLAFVSVQIKYQVDFYKLTDIILKFSSQI